MKLYEILMDELDHVPPDAKPVEFLMTVEVFHALKREARDLWDRWVEPPIFRTKLGVRHTFCNIPVTVTDEVDFAAVRYRPLPVARSRTEWEDVEWF